MVELLVAMVAMSILILIVGLLLLIPYKSMRGNEDYAQLRRDMSVALQTMTRDVRRATDADIDVSLGNELLLLANPDPPVRQKIAYKHEGHALNRYVNDINQGAVISSGLTRFSLVKPDVSTNGLAGVVVQLELQNDNGQVSMAHETFIHTRN